MKNLKNLKDGLTQESAYNLQKEILSGSVSTEELLEIFDAMSKRELGLVTKDELKGFVIASREVMGQIKTDKRVVDTCGTGGSGLDTFNISTASSFVCATAGVDIAKHGNKAVTGKCGSADVLEALGVNFQISAKQALELLNQTG